VQHALTVRTARWCAGHSSPVVATWLAFILTAGLSGIGAAHWLAGPSAGGPDLTTSRWPLVALVLGVVLLVLISPTRTPVPTLFTGVVAVASVVLLGAVSTAVPISPLAGDVAVLLVISMSVHHVLFALWRHREALAAGYDAADTAQVVASTAGSAALVTGGTIVLATAVLVPIGGAALVPLATAVLVVVLIATVAALSLLPAMNGRLRHPTRRPPAPPASLTVSRLPRWVRIATVAASALALGGLAGYGLLRVLGPADPDGVPLLDTTEAVSVTTLLTVPAVAMLVAFRPVVVTLVTVLLNLVSVLAGLGVLAALADPVPGWAPMALVVVLFASTTPFHVYLLHQLRSEALTGMSPRNTIARASRRAWTASGGALVVTCGMWVIWGLTGHGDVRTFGLSTAAVLAVDATLIRLLLLPKLVVLSGRTSWWRRVREPRNGR